ncbi:MAG: LysR substrate-binding domain-containing protein [Betaproteobacteria bacterium]
MPSLSSLKQLQYLLSVSEHLNFTRAADSCFVTQSTLSAGLKELEDTLSTRLVERDRQTVLMTPVGLEVAQRARSILSAAKDLVAFTAEAQAPMSGILRLGVIPTIAPFLLPPTVKALRKAYPQLRLALREDLTANLLSRLEGGQLDMALIALPYECSHLIVKPLFDDALWLVGRKGDTQLKARTVNVTQAMSEQMLLLEEGHCLREHALYACHASTRASHNDLEATSLLTLIQMIESGFGIGLVPEMALRSGLIKGSTLITRPLTKPSPTRTIALVARRSTPRQADLESLAQVILHIQTKTPAL